MSNWNTLAISSIFLTPGEKSALDAIDAGSTQGATVLTNVINEFRDCCRAGGYTLPATDATIPDMARVHVANRARWQWLCAFPALKALQTEARSKLNDAAEKFFNAVSARDQNVPTPTESTATVSGNWNSENKIVGRMNPVPRPGSQSGSSATNRYANPDGATDETQS